MTRTSETVVVDGVAKTRNQWCEYYSITPTIVRYRMQTLGATIEEAIRMGSRKGNAALRAKAIKAAIPLPNEPIRQCATDPDCWVTPDGRVWSNLHKRWLAVSAHVPNPGNPHKRYARVRVGRTQRYIHTVVAEAWVDNPKNLPWVWHKDTNTLNNHKDNLVWVTVQDIHDYRKETKERK